MSSPGAFLLSRIEFQARDVSISGRILLWENVAVGTEGHGHCVCIHHPFSAFTHNALRSLHSLNHRHFTSDLRQTGLSMDLVESRVKIIYRIYYTYDVISRHIVLMHTIV